MDLLILLRQLAAEDIGNSNHSTVLESAIADGSRHLHNAHNPAVPNDDSKEDKE